MLYAASKCCAAFRKPQHAPELRNCRACTLLLEPVLDESCAGWGQGSKNKKCLSSALGELSVEQQALLEELLSHSSRHWSIQAPTRPLERPAPALPAPTCSAAWMPGRSSATCEPTASGATATSSSSTRNTPTWPGKKGVGKGKVS